MVSLTRRFTLLSFAAVIAGCAVTHFEARVGSNPLKGVAEQATDDFSVKWLDENTLRVSDTWPLHSVLSIGYTAFHADLHYEAGTLEGDFYLKSNQLGFLFIPVYTNAGPGIWGIFLKPSIGQQMDQILSYAGTSRDQGKLTHSRGRTVARSGGTGTGQPLR